MPAAGMDAVVAATADVRNPPTGHSDAEKARPRMPDRSPSPAVQRGAPPTLPPYPASWVDRVLAGVSRWPASDWACFGALFATGHVLVAALRVRDGAALPEALTALPPPFLLWTVYLLALTHHLNGVARARLAAFRSVLDLDDAGLAEAEYRLTTMPAPLALRFGGLWVAIAVAILWWQWPLVVRLGYPLWEIGLTVASYMLGGAAIYHTAHQLREVSRLHARVTRVDLFDLEPLYAFSGLTSRTALGWLLLLYLTAIVVPAELARSALGATWVFVMGLAILAFVAPLMGIHRQLMAAKQRAIAAANARLRDTLAEINQRIDARDFGALDGLQKAAASLTAQRDILEAVSTWPWQAGTLRGFVTALLLPIALRVGQAVLERLLGL